MYNFKNYLNSLAGSCQAIRNVCNRSSHDLISNIYTVICLGFVIEFNKSN